MTLGSGKYIFLSKWRVLRIFTESKVVGKAGKSLGQRIIIERKVTGASRLGICSARCLSSGGAESPAQSHAAGELRGAWWEVGARGIREFAPSPRRGRRADDSEEQRLTTVVMVAVVVVVVGVVVELILIVSHHC